MDFWINVERTGRKIFMGKDWRIAAVNPTHLLNFRAKDLTMEEIQKRVDADFDSGSFPVKIKIETPKGKAFQLSRSGMISDNTVCTGTISQKGQRFLTFDLTA